MNKTMKLPNEFLLLNKEEMYDIQGGIGGVILAGLIIAAGSAIINDWDNFKAGLTGQKEIR